MKKHQFTPIVLVALILSLSACKNDQEIQTEEASAYKNLVEYAQKIPVDRSLNSEASVLPDPRETSSQSTQIKDKSKVIPSEKAIDSCVEKKCDQIHIQSGDDYLITADMLSQMDSDCREELTSKD